MPARRLLVAILFSLGFWQACQTAKKKEIEEQNTVDMPATPWGSSLQITPKEINQTWEELSEKYKVKKSPSTIVTFSGKIHTKYLTDDFLAGLMFQLKWKTLAEKIKDEYDRILKPLLADNPALDADLQLWIIKHAFFLGSNDSPALELLKRDNLFAKYENVANFEQKIQNFFAAISAFFPKYSRDYKKILIVGTTGFGGGHHVVATAIKSFLEKTFKDDLRVTYFDSKQHHQEADVFMQLTGQVHSESIYDDILQKEGNLAKANRYWQVLSEAKYYIPDNSLQELAEVIAIEKPSLLISCVHNRPEYISLAYFFDIPLLVVSTDYELQIMLNKYVGIIDPKLVNLSITTKDKIFLKKLSNYLASKGAYQAREERLAESLHQYMNDSISWDRFNKEFEVFTQIGFPVRREFIYGKDNPQVLLKHADFRQDATLVSVMMGRQGTKTIEEIVEHVVKNAGKFSNNLDIAITTGNNDELRKRLLKIGEKITNPAIKIFPLGMLDGDEMFNLYRLSKFVLSKSGGSTTAEVSMVKTPMLAIGYYPWEKINLEYLESLGLGYDVNNIEAVTESILRYQGQNLKAAIREFDVLNWQDNLIHLVRYRLKMDTSVR